MNATVQTARPEDLALQRLYHWEQTAPDKVILTQPTGGGAVRDYTWRQVMDEAGAWRPTCRRCGSRRAAASRSCRRTARTGCMATSRSGWPATSRCRSTRRSPPSTIRQILEHSEAKLLLRRQARRLGRDGARHPGRAAVHRAAAGAADARSAAGTTIVAQHRAAGRAARCAPPTSSATIIYTSGTTGQPKGVMHSFGTFAWPIAGGAEARAAARTDARMLSYLPLAHVAERALVEHALLATGMHVFFAESLDTFAADLQRARPTLFFSVPRLWVKFQQGVLRQDAAGEARPAAASIPIVGGIVRQQDPRRRSASTQCRFAARRRGADAARAAAPGTARLGLELLEGYGMTENCGVSHMRRVPGERARRHGRPAVRRASSARIDPATGEIQVQEPGHDARLLQGAGADRARRSPPTAGCTPATRARSTRQGSLRITGRVKELFKTSKGKYVAPAPIEDRLVMHAAIEACCVTGANLGQPFAHRDARCRRGRSGRKARARARCTRSSLEAHLEPSTHGSIRTSSSTAWSS